MIASKIRALLLPAAKGFIIIACRAGAADAADRTGSPDEMARMRLAPGVSERREAILSMMSDYKIATFGQDVERLLDENASDWVRREAARAFQKSLTTESATAPEGDAQVASLLAELDSGDSTTRTRALYSLGQLNVTNPQPVIEACLRLLQQDPKSPSLIAASVLARYHDERAVPFLRRVVELRQEQHEDDTDCVYTIARLGGPKSIALLNEMVGRGRRPRGDLEVLLVALGEPSSGAAVWEAYLRNPVRRAVSGWCATTVGYKDGLKVLRTCTDQELLEKIRDRAMATTEHTEKRILNCLVTEIEQRLSAEASPLHN